LPHLPGRDAHARAQPQENESEERGDLVIPQRPLVLVAAHDTDGGRERVGLAEDGVGDGDREIGNRVGVDDVAEVEDPDDTRIRYQDVVVVRIVVHDRPRQRLDARTVPEVDLLDQADDERAQRFVLDRRRQLADERQPPRQVPIEVAVDGRMVEALERAVELRHRGAKPLEKRRRMFPDRSERFAREPGEQPHEVTGTRRGRHLGDGIAIHTRNRAGTERRRSRHVRERRVLRFEQRPSVGPVRDLEDEPVSRRGTQHEVLVALAGKRRGVTVDAEQAPAEICRFVRRQGGHELEEIHAMIIDDGARRPCTAAADGTPRVSRHGSHGLHRREIREIRVIGGLESPLLRSAKSASVGRESPFEIRENRVIRGLSRL
jgi:hypothetical protein